MPPRLTSRPLEQAAADGITRNGMELIRDYENLLTRSRALWDAVLPPHQVPFRFGVLPAELVEASQALFSDNYSTAWQFDLSLLDKGFTSNPALLFAPLGSKIIGWYSSFEYYRELNSEGCQVLQQLIGHLCDVITNATGESPPFFRTA